MNERIEPAAPQEERAQETLAERVPLSTTESLRRATMTIAERVRTARIAANKTQQQLAGDTYSKSYISAVERGKMTPSVQALGVLAQRLGLPVSYFLGESEVDLGTLAQSATEQYYSPERERQQREEAARLMLQEAEGWIRQNQPDKALDTLNASAEQPPEDLPTFDRPRWYWLVGWASMLKERYNDAMSYLERGLNLTENLHAQAPLAQKGILAEMIERLRNQLGGCYYALGQTEMALEHHRRCLAAIGNEIVKDPELRLAIYKALGNDTLLLGRHKEAIGFYKEASRLADDMDEPRQQGLAYWGLGLAYKSSGDLFRAKVYYQKALVIFESLDNMLLASQMRSMFGQVLIQLRDYEEAEKNLRQSLGVAERTGDSHTRGLALANFADMHLAKGDPEKAIKAAQDGLEVVRQSNDRRTEGQLYLTLAEAYKAKHDEQATEQAYKDAIRVLEQTQDREFIGRAHEQYGQFLADRGHFQEAYQHMHIARAILVRRAGDL